MDMNDVEEDSQYGVQTIPVKYGRRNASIWTMAFTIIMSTFSLLSPRSSSKRQIGLAMVGSLVMLYRSLRIVFTKGENKDIVDRAIEEGKITVLLLLASFV
eukprot:CAMPEP_0116827936 /NCGR_PEP_ID=MMETSP0418-20121206/3380_1 /TAXON_ID=1158023 /ORGANISM="Astrosyne radiata, Strain 13vi08-1A" /LENGTH=100 /DNA_ID=CAMNT_0004456775 /DNA_START=211 /DNA_END=513 /DNA_ORIENTATION=-